MRVITLTTSHLAVDLACEGCQTRVMILTASREGHLKSVLLGYHKFHLSLQPLSSERMQQLQAKTALEGTIVWSY